MTKKKKRTPTTGTVIQLQTNPANVGSPVNIQTVPKAPQTAIGTQGQYGQPSMIQGQHQGGVQSPQMFNGQAQYRQQPVYVVDQTHLQYGQQQPISVDAQGEYGHQRPMSMDDQAYYGNQQPMHMVTQGQNGLGQQPIHVVDGNGQYIQTVQQQNP